MDDTSGGNTSTPTAGTTTLCGNGRLDAGERCDDGNAVNTDGCTSRCVICGTANNCTPKTDDGHGYLFHTKNIDWSGAVVECTQLGGHLATIDSAAEHAFLAPLISDERWIGASDQTTEGTWRWVTQEPFQLHRVAGGKA